jgi:hypothetical protein
MLAFFDGQATASVEFIGEGTYRRNIEYKGLFSSGVQRRTWLARPGAVDPNLTARTGWH